MALQCGLDAAIMNPYSAEMMKTFYACRALTGLDEGFASYIAFAQQVPEAQPTAPAAVPAVQAQEGSALQQAIVRGLREQAALLTDELLSGTQPLCIVQQEIIPALNRVGVGFENKTVYLPQLLMSAEAAKAAFERIKTAMPAGGGAAHGPFVLATVQGDIHDIGKNIVRLLLENYGFQVVDLGRDVAPETVAETVVRLHAPLAGLSALMTTTVPAMEKTIRLLHSRAPWCRVIVGGAVLTQEYAHQIGADAYARDAMEVVRAAEAMEP